MTTEISETSFEVLLNEWEDSQGERIRQTIFQGIKSNDPGAANLHLAYLAVKFLMRRLKLSTSTGATHRDMQLTLGHHLQTQKAAQEIVQFVQALDEHQIYGFWFPMHAYSLTSATSFLVRHALSRNSANQATSRRSVCDMITALRNHRRKYDWDLADNCLTNCKSVMEKLNFTTTHPDTVTTDRDMISELPMTGLDETTYINLEDYLQIELRDYNQEFEFLQTEDYFFSNPASMSMEDNTYFH